MSERDVRTRLQQISDRLDRAGTRTSPTTSASAGLLMPLVLGAGLAVAACSESDPGGRGEAYGMPTTTSTGSGLTGAGGAGDLYGMPGGAGGEAGAGVGGAGDLYGMPGGSGGQ